MFTFYAEQYKPACSFKTFYGTFFVYEMLTVEPCLYKEAVCSYLYLPPIVQKAVISNLYSIFTVYQIIVYTRKSNWAHDTCR